MVKVVAYLGRMGKLRQKVQNQLSALGKRGSRIRKWKGTTDLDAKSLTKSWQSYTVLILAMGAMLFTAVSYGRMATAFPVAGSTYAYSTHGLHPVAGFLTGWGMLLELVLVPPIRPLFLPLRAAFRFAPHPAKHSLDQRNQFLHNKRLDDVIICPIPNPTDSIFNT